MPERVALINLGCPKNLVDAEVMLGHLRAQGFETTADLDSADVVVVNTCGFLEASAQESVDTLLATAGRKGTGRLRKVVAAGCMTQRYGADVVEALPEVDGFLGVGQAHLLPGVVRRTLDGERLSLLGGPSAGFEGYGLRLQATPSHTAYLKVSEGCDRHCAFCVIPKIRGPMVSRTLDDLVTEAEVLVAQGTRELILIGQDPVRYGNDLHRSDLNPNLNLNPNPSGAVGSNAHGTPAIVTLLQRLNAIPDLRWIRLMYLFPDRTAPAVLEAVAGLSKVCKYIDMPLQHASETVLRSMNRPGGAQDYRRMLTNVRRLCPDLSLRSTFIVGFPGETDAQFQELMDFAAEVELDWVGVFRYSREDDTPAGTRPGQIAKSVSRRRHDALMAQQQRIAQQRHQRWVGRKLEILVESVALDGGHGRTQGQAPEIDGETRLDLSELPGVRAGDFILAEVTGAGPYDLEARALELLHRPPLRHPDLIHIRPRAVA